MSSRASTVASDDMFSHHSVSSCTTYESLPVKQSISKPVLRPAVQQYESEIEKCIRAGLIDRDMPQGPGLPPLPPLEKTSSMLSRQLSGDKNVSQPTQSTIDRTPSRKLSAEVIGGLQRLANMLRSYTSREQCAIKQDTNAYWNDLSTAEQQAEREVRTKWRAIESSWRKLDEGFEAEGKQSRRVQLREGRDSRRRQWVEMKKERDCYLDKWLLDLDGQRYR